jgi:hypothetical protein
MKDPIVEEVRRARRERSARFNHDLDAMFEDLRRSEKQSKARGAKFVSPKPRKSPALELPAEDLQTPLAIEEAAESTGDPIVEEVRTNRETQTAQFGFNVRAIAEDARKSERKSGRRLVSFVDRKRRRVAK